MKTFKELFNEDLESHWYGTKSNGSTSTATQSGPRKPKPHRMSKYDPDAPTPSAAQQDKDNEAAKQRRIKKHREKVAAMRASGESMRGENFSNWRDDLLELNRYEKETGKSSGGASYRSGVNTPREGTPTKKGGSSDKMVHFGKGLVRQAEGRPTGQTRRSYDERGKETDRKESPKATVTKRREMKARADAAMRDTSGT